MGQKIKILLLLLIIFGGTNTYAQVYLDSLNNQANAMLIAYSKSDYKTLLKRTHPKVAQTMGGVKSAEANLRKSIEALTASGFSFKNVKLGKPSDVVKTGQNYQCIIPQFATAEINGKKLAVKSNLLCMSYDGGKNWYFINAEKSQEASLRKLIPEISSKLVIPNTEFVPQ
ncbi:hypothetical protein [Pedobacter psychrodurus]|uniref:hypothetical protein n=1 Tax=Pedobacter psychrodurus TaxID=2530456 RepID=UPI0029312730|nr:hypothetical protein [Pedobacter psychrodurus]